MKYSPLHRFVAVVLVASAGGLSCTPSTAEDGSGGMGGEPDEGSGGDASGGDGSGGDDSSGGGQGGEPSVLAPCEEPSGEGTVPDWSVTEDTTWTAAGSPYHVPSGLSITGATVTLEACTVVMLGEDAWIEIEEGGALVAQGEILEDEAGEQVTRPVAFGPEEEGVYWGGLIVLEGGSLDLTVTGLLGGGSLNSDGVISAEGHNGALPVLQNVRVRGVYIEDAETYGVNLGRYAAFTDDSEALEITGVDSFPIRTSVGGLSTLPTGLYEGNATDEILVEDGNRFADDVSIRQLGVPYHFATDLHIDGDEERPGPFTLSIEAGTILTFAEDTRVDLGTSSAVEDPAYFYPVGLDLDGTADEPIVFTSAADDPAAGDWVGIHWGGGPSSGNVFDHVVVEYAGGESQANGFGCGNSTTNGALVIYSWLPDDVFVTQSTFAYSAGGGIVSGWNAMVPGPNLTGDNTFIDINPDFCEVSQPAVDNTCPGNDSEPDCY